MNREQLRGKNAFELARGSDSPGKFLRLAQKLPAMLQTNGLLATCAHCLAAKDREFRDIREGLLKHLRDCGLEEDPRDLKGVFLDVWTSPDFADSRLQKLTAEAIHFSAWLKRAAEAVCDTESDRVVSGTS